MRKMNYSLSGLLLIISIVAVQRLTVSKILGFASLLPRMALSFFLANP